MRQSAPMKIMSSGISVFFIQNERLRSKLLTKINYLANGLASGDFGPTKQQREVQALLKQQLAEQKQRMDEVLKQDLPAFNKVLADNNVKIVIKP